jgi:hypothetical protein
VTYDPAVRPLSEIPPQSCSLPQYNVFLTVCAGQVAKKDNSAVFQEVCADILLCNGVIDVFAVMSSLSQNTTSSEVRPHLRAHPGERLGVRSKTALRS